MIETLQRFCMNDNCHLAVVQARIFSRQNSKNGYTIRQKERKQKICCISNDDQRCKKI